MTKLMNVLAIVLAVATAVAVVAVYQARAQHVPGTKLQLRPMATFCADKDHISAIALAFQGKRIHAMGTTDQMKTAKIAIVELWQSDKSDEFTLMIRIDAWRCILLDGSSWTAVKPKRMEMIP